MILEIENKENVESFFDFWKLSLSPKGFPCGEENGLKLLEELVEEKYGKEFWKVLYE